MVDDFERMWSDLAPVGRSARSGGYFRQPFTEPERELAAWFRDQASARGLELESDAFGNLVAWWDPSPRAVVRDEVALPADAMEPEGHGLGRGGAGGAGAAGGAVVRDEMALPAGGTEPEGHGLRRRSGGVLTGSHLDSVLDGGAYDGPLGVVSALAAVDELRSRGVVPARPVGVSVFAEEEGSRFGVACLGSRLATGASTWEQVRGLRDRAGVALEEVVEGGGPGLLADVGTFVELHVEQGRDLVDRGAAIGVASGIWPHGRYRFDFTGQANHAGSTRMEDRADPMLTYAMTALAANKQARLSGSRATFGRVEVTPNGTNAVPSRVRAWLDARCASEDELAELVETVTRQATERAGRDGTALAVTPESVSGAVGFDTDLATRIAADHEEGDWPVLPTAAGHDAGILSAAGIPTAMLFVRNPTGISHSPEEHAELPDCLAGVHALAETLERLAT